MCAIVASLGWASGSLVWQLELLILVVDDLQKEHPTKLRNSLRVTVHAGILAHNVLN